MNTDKTSAIKSKILVATGFLFIVFCLIILFYTALQKKTAGTNKSAENQQHSANTGFNNGVVTDLSDEIIPRVASSQLMNIFPQVKFASYQNKATLPALPSFLNTLTVKTDFTPAEITQLSTELNLEKKKQSGDYTILYSEKNKELLAINKNNGSFVYETYSDPTTGGLSVKYASSSLQQKAVDFLNGLGMNDSAIVCPVTYQKKGYERFTFVECHRDWNRVGVSIMNLAGILGTPDTTPLQDLGLGKTVNNSDDDATIINVSTGENGKKRPNEFNTATFIFDKDNHIVAAKSNIRYITKVTSTTTDLLTPQEALARFTSGKSDYSMATVAGQGSVDQRVAFPSGKAEGSVAVITDYVLTYLEEPPTVSQKELVPMYVIRGYSDLNSGYRATFVEVVPALKSKLTAQVLGVATGQVLAETSTSSTPGGSLNLVCLKNAGTAVDSFTQDGANKKVSLKGEGFAANQPVVIVACLKKGSTEITQSKDCTTGNTTLDAQYGLSTNPGFTFKVEGANPVTSTANGEVSSFTATTFSKEASSNMYFYGSGASASTGKDNTGSDSGQKQGTLDLGTAQKDCARISWSACKPSESELEPQPLLTYNGVTYGKWKHPQKGNVWYYVPAPGVVLTEEKLWNDIQAIKDQLVGEGVSNGLRLKERIMEEFRELKANGSEYCPIRITGSSPTLFIYGKQGNKLTIRPQFPLIYTDTPRDGNGSWQVTIGKRGLVQENGLERPYIYYEYDQTPLISSSSGWIVKKEALGSVTATLAGSLRLSSLEKQRLMFELEKATTDVKDGTLLSVLLVPEKVVAMKLPLQISQKVDHLYRFHFVLKKNQGETMSVPVLNPIQRSGLTIVEFGATSE